MFLGTLDTGGGGVRVIARRVTATSYVRCISNDMLGAVVFAIFSCGDVSFGRLITAVLGSGRGVSGLLRINGVPSFIIRVGARKGFPTFKSKVRIRDVLPTGLAPSAPAVSDSDSPSLTGCSVPVIYGFVSCAGTVEWDVWGYGPYFG